MSRLLRVVLLVFAFPMMAHAQGAVTPPPATGKKPLTIADAAPSAFHPRPERLPAAAALTSASMLARHAVMLSVMPKATYQNLSVE